MSQDTQREERMRFRELVTAELASFAQYKSGDTIPADDVFASFIRIKSGINPDKPRTND